jgi:hypothetical protein
VFSPRKVYTLHADRAREGGHTSGKWEKRKFSILCVTIRRMCVCVFLPFAPLCFVWLSLFTFNTIQPCFRRVSDSFCGNSKPGPSSVYNESCGETQTTRVCSKVHYLVVSASSIIEDYRMSQPQWYTWSYLLRDDNIVLLRRYYAHKEDECPRLHHFKMWLTSFVRFGRKARRLRHLHIVILRHSRSSLSLGLQAKPR